MEYCIVLPVSHGTSCFWCVLSYKLVCSCMTVVTVNSSLLNFSVCYRGVLSIFMVAINRLLDDIMLLIEILSLQVHVVEGAGLVKGSSGKPYNAFVRW